MASTPPPPPDDLSTMHTCLELLQGGKKENEQRGALGGLERSGGVVYKMAGFWLGADPSMTFPSRELVTLGR